jgi:hypothetical protein
VPAVGQRIAEYEWKNGGISDGPPNHMYTLKMSRQAFKVGVCLCSIFVASGIAVPFLVNAQSAVKCDPRDKYCALAPLPGLTDRTTVNAIFQKEGNFEAFLNNLYVYLIGGAAILTVIMITWGGAEIAWNRESVARILDGKGKILNALFGLVVVLSPVIVFAVINPEILKLNLSMPALRTSWGTYKAAIGGDDELDATGKLREKGSGGFASCKVSSGVKKGSWCYTDSSGVCACGTTEAMCKEGLERDGKDPSTHTCRQVSE